MTQRHTDDYNLTLPPYTFQEIEDANAEIDAWHDSGAVLADTPVDALTKINQQALATAQRLLGDLADPAIAQSMSAERKQKYLDTFNGALDVHLGSWLDVAGLQEEAERLKAETQRVLAEEGERVVKWTKLSTLLKEKEELVTRLAKKATEMEAETPPV